MLEVNVNSYAVVAGEDPVPTGEDKKKSFRGPTSASDKTVRPKVYRWASASSLLASSQADPPVKQIFPVTLSSLTFTKSSNDRRALLSKAMSWTAQKASGAVVQGCDSLENFSEDERKKESSEYSSPESNSPKQNIVAENEAATLISGDNDAARKTKRCASKSRRPTQRTRSSKSRLSKKRSSFDKQIHEESKGVNSRRRPRVSRATSESSTLVRQNPGTRPRSDVYTSSVSRRRLLQPADQSKRLSSRQLIKRAASARTVTSNRGNEKVKPTGAAINKCRDQQSTSKSSNKKNQKARATPDFYSSLSNCHLPQSAAACHFNKTSGLPIQDSPPSRPLQRASSARNVSSKKSSTESHSRSSQNMSRRGNSSMVQGASPPRLLQKAGSARNFSYALTERQPLRQRLQRAASARSLAGAVDNIEGNEESPVYSIKRTSSSPNRRARGSSRCRRNCQMHTQLAQAQLLPLSRAIQEREQKEEDIKRLRSKYDLKQTINYDSPVPCNEKATALVDQAATMTTSRLEKREVHKKGLSLVRSLFGPEMSAMVNVPVLDIQLPRIGDQTKGRPKETAGGVFVGPESKSFDIPQAA